MDHVLYVYEDVSRASMFREESWWITYGYWKTFTFFVVVMSAKAWWTFTTGKPVIMHVTAKLPKTFTSNWIRLTVVNLD